MHLLRLGSNSRVFQLLEGTLSNGGWNTCFTALKCVGTSLAGFPNSTIQK
jgi:hypothetical protein